MCRFDAYAWCVMDRRRLRRLRCMTSVGRLHLMRAPSAPKGGGTCPNVPPPPLNTPLAVRQREAGAPLLITWSDIWNVSTKTDTKAWSRLTNRPPRVLALTRLGLNRNARFNGAWTGKPHCSTACALCIWGQRGRWPFQMQKKNDFLVLWNWKQWRRHEFFVPWYLSESEAQRLTQPKFSFLLGFRPVATRYILPKGQYNLVKENKKLWKVGSQI